MNYFKPHGTPTVALINLNFNDIQSQISCFQDFIFTIKFRQLPSHLKLDAICNLFPNITNVDIKYVAKNVKTNYEEELFEAKLSETSGIGKAIRNMQFITSLTLSNNQIDDDILRQLVKEMGNTCLASTLYLDLSHNQITTNGFRILINKVLGPGSVLRNLNVADNRIQAEGGRSLGRLLRSNQSLVNLDLRLNRLEDLGGKMLMDCLRDNNSLVALNISSNLLRSETAAALAAMMKYSHQNKMRSIDLSCNKFRKKDLLLLLPIFEKNSQFTFIDLRMNKFVLDNETKLKIENICEKNEFEFVS